jgi:CRP-like cAMP-binding protein
MIDLPSLELDTPLTHTEVAELESLSGGIINRPAGTVLIGEDESIDNHALLIQKGVVKVVAGKPRQIVYLRGTGQMVGEMAAIRRKPRSASVIALTDIQALYVPGVRWIEFMFNHPRVALAQIVTLDERLAEATKKNVDSFLASERKLAKALLELESMGVGTRVARGIALRFSQKELAEIAGISIESAKDAIGLLKTRGIVQTGRGELVVCDLDAIDKIARGETTASL